MVNRVSVQKVFKMKYKTEIVKQLELLNLKVDDSYVSKPFKSSKSENLDIWKITNFFIAANKNKKLIQIKVQNNYII